MGVVNAVEWVPVESRLFTSAAYRADSQQLYLRLHDGSIYRYFECPVSVYRDFLAAESKGRYFSQYIRNRFRYEQVRRKNAAGSGCESLHPDIAEQLSSSVRLAKARAVQKRAAAQLAGVQE